jgi:Tfp pilus assembly protein PilW
MIGLVVSTILIIGLTRLYSTTLSSYCLQNQLTEMNQNAKFAIKAVSAALMQAGADCILLNNDTLQKDTLIKTSRSPCSDFTVKVNPMGGLFVIAKQCTLNTSTACSLQVDNGYAFTNASNLAKIPNAVTSSSRSVQTYTLQGVNTADNKICISGGYAGDIFYQDDGVYSFVNRHYYLNGSNLCLDSNNNVLAENIDSLVVTFLDSLGATTRHWNFMNSVGLTIESTTSQPDNRYNDYPDHRRRLKLSYQFKLKNKG